MSSSSPMHDKTPAARLRRLVIGPPRDVTDPHVFHQVSLVAFLAWVGLGADGLSSSAYGPEEAYLALGGHTFLALPLAILMAITVFVISASYRPHHRAISYGRRRIPGRD